MDAEGFSELTLYEQLEVLFPQLSESKTVELRDYIATLRAALAASEALFKKELAEHTAALKAWGTDHDQLTAALAASEKTGDGLRCNLNERWRLYDERTADCYRLHAALAASEASQRALREQAQELWAFVAVVSRAGPDQRMRSWAKDADGLLARLILARAAAPSPQADDEAAVRDNLDLQQG